MGSPTLPTTGTSTIIRNGETRGVRHAKVRGFPCGSYQLAGVYLPPTAILTARCLRNFSTDTEHPRGKLRVIPIMVSLTKERHERYFRFLRLSNTFEFATLPTISIPCSMAEMRAEQLPAQVPTEYQLAFRLQTAASFSPGHRGRVPSRRLKETGHGGI